MAYTAVFLSQDGRPFQGQGPHSVQAGGADEVRDLAIRLLGGAASAAAGFRVLNPAGEVVEDWPAGRFAPSGTAQVGGV